MDLDQLHTFLEIVRLKSFSKAAQSCFRTQPAVSAQVRQLETELNSPLFERLGTKIALTPAGHIFAEYSEQILELRRRAQDTINELERQPRGELLIAANEATCIYVLPRVFSEYKKQFPNVQILVDRSYGARVVEAVLDNQADFGITQLPVTEKRLQVVKIHSDEIRVLMPAQHPLAQNRQVLPADLLGYPLLTSGHVEAWLPLIGTVPLTSAMGFDTGVYLVVFGGVMLILSMMGTVKPPRSRKAGSRWTSPGQAVAPADVNPREPR